jgi:hypothetical protein
MELAAKVKTFKSPKCKLLPFFLDSRDSWKAKAEERTVRIKRLKNRVSVLKQSRQKWKEEVQACRSQIAALQQELERQKNGSP